MEIEFPKRGQIWVLRLDPTVGAEIKKTRPALIISNDICNKYTATVTVLPITSQASGVQPFEVSLSPPEGGLLKDSKIKSQQIRTVDKSRLVKLIGAISQEKLRQTEQALLIHLDIQVFR